jgi:nicotinamide riboside kinase
VTGRYWIPLSIWKPREIQKVPVYYFNVESYVPSYDHLFLLDPANVPYEQDEVRTETPEERMLIHNTFVRFFREHGIPHHVLSGTPEEKYTTVLESLVRDSFGDSTDLSLSESQHTNSIQI